MLLVWVGVVALLALAAAGVSLALHRRAGNPLDLAHQVNQQRLDLDELFDRVDQWQRRDRVRRLRASHEPPEAPAAPQRGSPEYKQFLRNKARGGALQ